MSAATTQSDDVASLVPAPSPWRNATLAVGAVAALVAAWLSADVLRVSLGAVDGGGMWAPLEAGNHVAVARQLEPSGFPWVEVTSVADAPGAVVEGAWLMTDDDLFAETFDPDVPTGATALEELRLRFPEADLPEGGGLPQRLTGADDDAVLVVLWRIEDCAALDETPAQVELRSVLGAGPGEELDDVTSPGFDLELLRAEGICPA